MNAAERVRLKLIALMSELEYSQRDLAERLARSQPWVAKAVRGPKKGGLDIRLEDLDDVALALGVTAVEMIRDPGLEFVADLTPTEMRLLQLFRKLPGLVQAATMTLVKAQTSQSDTQRPKKTLKTASGKP